MTEQSIRLSELPEWPRLLTADEAARYLGVSRNLFDLEVRQGLWPQGLPRGVRGGKMTWDKQALDRRIDELTGAANGPIRRKGRQQEAR